MLIDFQPASLIRKEKEPWKKSFLVQGEEPKGKQQRVKEAPGIKKREEQTVKTENEPNDVLKPSLGRLLDC